MKRGRIAGIVAVTLRLAIWVPAGGGALQARENIDPLDDGSRHAWSENAGWINARPLGAGGPGADVGDLALTGWLWSENAGWISLSCANRATCDAVTYGVANNGAGVLSGFAWAENIGWINFFPAGGGVRIDPGTGLFSGRAWGENIGWITFGSDGPVPYHVRAGCPDGDGDAVPRRSFLCPAGSLEDCNDADAGAWGTPGEVPDLDVLSDTRTLVWAAPAIPGGSSLAYDSLRTLAPSDFAATAFCLESGDGADVQADDPLTPAPGQAFYYLSRAVNGCPAGLGRGPLGTASDGTPRAGRDCP